MKRKRTVWNVILGVMLICVVCFGFFCLSGDIGVRRSNLEEDIRSSQKIADDWVVEGMASDAMAAYISYPEDGSKHTFSIYVNHPGLSFGYFFRGGGSSSGVAEYIAKYTVEGCQESAFISMNKQGAARLEIDDGNSVQVIDIDQNKPFAIVLPANAGAVTFYDMAGDTVEYWESPL